MITKFIERGRIWEKYVCAYVSVKCLKAVTIFSYYSCYCVKKNLWFRNRKHNCQLMNTKREIEPGIFTSYLLVISAFFFLVFFPLFKSSLKVFILKWAFSFWYFFISAVGDFNSLSPLNFAGTNPWTKQTLLFHHHQLQEEWTRTEGNCFSFNSEYHKHYTKCCGNILIITFSNC